MLDLIPSWLQKGPNDSPSVWHRFKIDLQYSTPHAGSRSAVVTNGPFQFTCGCVLSMRVSFGVAPRARNCRAGLAGRLESSFVVVLFGPENEPSQMKCRHLKKLACCLIFQFVLLLLRCRHVEWTLEKTQGVKWIDLIRSALAIKK